MEERDGSNCALQLRPLSFEDSSTSKAIAPEKELKAETPTKRSLIESMTLLGWI